MDDDVQQEAERVDEDVPLAALDPLACKIARNFGSGSLFVLSLLRLVLCNGLGGLGLNTLDDEAC